jgi:hypothetical protein
VKTILAAFLALILGVNAVAMLFAARWWYGAVPGVTATGPFNPHFIKDIGAAYLAVAAALAWSATRPTAGAGAAMFAAGFLGLHALIHVADEIAGGHAMAEFIRDFPGVFVPALLSGWIAWPTRKLS